jgi:hypothetical protein
MGIQDEYNLMIVEQANRLRSGIEAAQKMMYANTAVENWSDIVYVLIAGKNKLREYQQIIADAASPYFEVK